MATKYKFINELYNATLKDISSNKENWKSFLTTASMNYKYSFTEQVLIYAQKPDAKACASIETWNKLLKRWVNKGAKGIALLTEKNGYSGLTYVFDVSDTNSRYGKNIELWRLDKIYENDVIESLENKFGNLVSTEDIYNTVLSVTSNIIEDNIDEYIEDIISNKENTSLSNLSDNEIKAIVYELLLNSIAYTTLNRSGLNADSFIRDDSFNNIELFSNRKLLLILGTMNNELSRLELNEIYSTLKNLRLNEIRTFDNTKVKEYNIDNERSGNDDRLQNGRGLSNSEPRDSKNNREDTREVFNNEIKSLEESQESRVSRITDDRRVGETLNNDSGTSSDEIRQDDGRINYKEQYNRGNETNRSNEMDSRDEQYQESSRRNDNSRTNINLSLFPTEEEQKEIVEVKENASTFFVSKEDIDKCLLRGSSVVEGKYRIYQNLTTNLSTKDSIEFMKQEYGWGGGTLNMEKNLSHQHDAKGITITKYGSDEFYFMNWSTVIKEIKELINDERWFNSKEKEGYQNWLLNKEVQSVDIDEDKTYQYYLGAKVYIGTEEFEILEFNDNFVKLYDSKYPLFNQEYSREDFDKKVKENPANDHLIQNEDIIEFINTDDEEIKLLYKILNKHKINDIKLEKNNNDIIATDSDNTWYNNEIYDFIFDEVIVDNNLVSNEDLEKLNDCRNKYPKTIKEKEYSTEELIGLEVNIDNRNFVIENIKDDEVELRDIGYHMEVGYPIFTTTNLENVLNNLREDNFEIYSIKENKKDNVIAPTVSDSSRLNFKITNNDIGVDTPKERYKNNIRAIKVLKECENNNRLATKEEQIILSNYVGWGGLSEAFDINNSSWSNEYLELKQVLTNDEYNSARESTLTAFYTPPVVINAMYKTIENMGFNNGNILEPSCGTGNFIGMLPDNLKDSKVYGVELDSISGRIARQLYQKSSITISGFEKTELPNSFFDVAISNVPFGDFKVNDKKYDKHKFLIHDYFFAKTLDKVRPGGVIAFITSKGTLDKENPTFRKYLSQRADLLGAIRLPDNTFKASAGTEVTSDIIFLQKRDSITDKEQDWVYLDTNEDGIKMNKYFIDNPDMIMGNMIMQSTRFGMDSTCKLEDNNLEELLHGAITNIYAEIKDYEIEDVGENEITFIEADPTVKNFSYTIKDDLIYYRENSRMYLQELPIATTNRIIGLIDIRDTTRKLIEYQLENYSDEEIKNLQSSLNEKYDKFTKKYGLINSRGNKTAFENDDSYYLLCSLEILDENQGLKQKADIFSKRTIKPNIEIDKVDTSNEALILSLSEKGRIDFKYMMNLTDKLEEEIKEDLKGIIFNVPDSLNEYQTADEYLSGNIREKLSIAKTYAVDNEQYKINVEHLEKVLPKDIEASDISVRLGATWIPSKYINDFKDYLFEPHFYIRDRINISFMKTTGEWNISNKSADRSNLKVHNSFGTHRANGYKILEDSLNLKDVRIFDYEVDENGKKIAVLNKKETAIACSKQDLIKQEFEDWIWTDPTRREELTRIYNDKFNSIRNREFDGSNLTFKGMNPEIKLREHQLNAVARVLFGGNTLLAHEVGAGKTFTMVASAMESKRLGLCNKSLFVVPNHLVEQFSSEFLQLYPSSNILVTTKKDFEKSNRKKFCSRIATGDYDAVIISHSQFEKIPMSIKRQVEIIEEQINSITIGIKDLKENNGERFSVKQLEKTKKALITKLDKLNDTTRKDDVITFEELGVDRIFVDEAHYYKNLFLYTKMRNVAGIAQVEAQKSSDLFMKCRYLDEITKGKGIVFATGTPISNSMVELYTMQRYLQYGLLKQNGLEHFDSWASTFGERVSAIELAPEGNGYRAKTRFAKFFNLPELMSMFKETADIQTSDMLKLPVPIANYHNIVVKPSEIQKNLVEELSERAEKIRNKMVDSTVDNMLKITNDGRKLALDQRLMNDLLPSEESGKVMTCVNNIYDIYNKHSELKLTQLVFCDMSTPSKDKFNIYDELKKSLISKGILEEEIAFIHTADTDIRKKEMFNKVRSGQIRVLMGSTQKMGAGTNVQDKLIALHDLDCPWRPSDLIQRSGRIVRQGNQNEEVDIFRYVTESTFDAYLFQLVENKQKFISQIMTGKTPVRFAEDIDETALSYAEIKALASGNPLILEKTELDTEVAKLKLLKQSYLSSKYDLENKVLKHFPNEIKMYEGYLKDNKEDIITLKDNTKITDDKFQGITLQSSFIPDKELAGKKILDICKSKSNSEKVEIGNYRGFKMILSFDIFSKTFMLDLKNKLSYKVELGSDVYGNITRIDNTLSNIDKQEQYKNKINDIETNLENAKTEIDKPFKFEEALKVKTKRLNEINKSLDLNEKETIVIDSGEVEETSQMYKNDLAR